MKTGRIGSLALRYGAAGALTLGLGAAATLGSPPEPAAAQSTSDCRCVDRDGNEIERCSCFRAPRIEVFGGGWGMRDARPRIGISVDVRQSSRRDASGALVTDVLRGGPADEAGIERGDFITSVDGHSLQSPLPGDVEDDFDLDDSVPVQRLLAVLRDVEPGEEVTIEYERDGETRTATIEAEELSSWGRGFAGPDWGASELREGLRGLTDELRSHELRSDDFDDLGERIRDRVRLYVPRGGDGRSMRFFGDGDGPGVIIDRYRGIGYGLELVALNPSLGGYFGVEEGVLVADVDDDSTLGLRPGDVVTAVGDRPVTTPDRMRRILQSYGPDEEITLHVRRDGSDTQVMGRLGR